MLARSKWMMAGIAALTAAVIWAVAAPAAQASAAEADTPPAVSATSPSAAEVEALQYMREEEKLARDVYLALYEEWQLPIFQTIAGSESQHMEAMLTLIEKYGLTDPAAGKAEGEFTNPELQALYAQLVAQGSKSAVDALKVGATIEDLDIADLMEALENMTSDDIRFAMENCCAARRITCGRSCATWNERATHMNRSTWMRRPSQRSLRAKRGEWAPGAAAHAGTTMAEGAACVGSNMRSFTLQEL